MEFITSTYEGFYCAVERFTIRPRFRERLSHQGYETSDMIPRRQFRHHSPIGLMHGNLAEKPVGQQPPLQVIDTYGSLVARGFDPDYPHEAPRPCPTFAFCRGAH